MATCFPVWANAAGAVSIITNIPTYPRRSLVPPFVDRLTFGSRVIGGGCQYSFLGLWPPMLIVHLPPEERETYGRGPTTTSFAHVFAGLWGGLVLRVVVREVIRLFRVSGRRGARRP
jgi:hypothetical protein